MKTLEDRLDKYALKEPVFPDEHPSSLIGYFNLFSSIATESFYVLDIPQKQFYYVKPDDLFLCGLSIGEALRQGHNFYFKIVCPDDLPLWTAMLKTVLRYLKDFEEKRDKIDYFSCSFRLQRFYSFHPRRPLLQMVYHRINHIWENNELRYLICSVRSSTIKEVGNLRMYNKDGLTYEEYNFTTKHWKQKTKEPLTERERAILMLAEQGKSTIEIADYLCKGQNTIRNQIKSLFTKLNVHSMQEAIECACNQHLIYPKPDMELQSIQNRNKT